MEACVSGELVYAPCWEIIQNGGVAELASCFCEESPSEDGYNCNLEPIPRPDVIPLFDRAIGSHLRIKRINYA